MGGSLRSTNQVLAAPLVQVKALVAALPLRLKILDVAGSAASIYTFEPGLGDGSSAAAESPRATSPRQAADTDMLKLWLIYRPGHYEVVYPEESSENLEKL